MTLSPLLNLFGRLIDCLGRGLLEADVETKMLALSPSFE